MSRHRKLALLSSLAFCFVLLAGCGGSTTTTIINPPPPPPPPAVEPNNCKSTNTTSPAQPAPTANAAGPSITGFVKAGNLPITNAAVALYAAVTTNDGQPTVSILSPFIPTDANGAFTIPAGYACPYSNSVLYVGAAGGETNGTENDGIALRGVLGVCSSISNGASFMINEATTAATAYAMAQFLRSEAIDASATNSSGLVLAAATAANLVDPTTGTAPGIIFPSTGSAPIAKINTLANLLNACVVSGTGSSACTDLYNASSTGGTPTNTFAAAVNIAQHPGTNISSLYTLSTASSAYTPALTTAPPDWTLAVNYTGGGMKGPSAVSIDSTGKIWVANYYAVASLFSNTGAPLFPHGITGDQLENSFGGAVDVDDTFWAANEESDNFGTNNGLGSISVLTNTGTLNGIYSSGGINFPLSVAFDTSGNSWVVDYGDSSITLLDPTGAPLSGAAGYSSSNLVFPVAVATDAKCNAYVANQSSNTLTRVLADGSAFTDYTVGDGPSGVAIDSSGNVWSANYYGDSVGLVSSTSGTVVSGHRLHRRRHRPPPGHRSRRLRQRLGRQLSRPRSERAGRSHRRHARRHPLSRSRLGSRRQPGRSLRPRHRRLRQHLDHQLCHQHPHRVRRPGQPRPDPTIRARPHPIGPRCISAIS